MADEKNEALQRLIAEKAKAKGASSEKIDKILNIARKNEKDASDQIINILKRG